MKNEDLEQRNINEIVSAVLAALIGDLLSLKEPVSVSDKNDLAKSFRNLLFTVVSELNNLCAIAKRKPNSENKNSQPLEFPKNATLNGEEDHGKKCEKMRKRKEIHEVQTSGKVFVSTSSDGHVSLHFESFC